MFSRKKIAAFLLAIPMSLLLSVTAFAASYTVAAGDSLYTVGRIFNMTAAQVKESSGLTSNTIYPGQVLTIPSWSYTVKSGDSLYLIAKRYRVTVFSLRKLNNEWDNTLLPGQRLNISNFPWGTAQAVAAPVQSTGTTAYTQTDLDLLARLITAEAEGQPYTAMVAVGAVVLNRVEDPRFPTTIRSVIYDRSYGYYQFTPVMNGYINKPASETAKKAALAALNGADPTKGAMYYFDDSATNTWLWAKPLALRSGDMVYVY